MSEKRPLVLTLLIVLSLEKFVQHMVVTAAFLLDFQAIRDTVVVDYRLLVISGFLVGIIFLLNVRFLIHRRAFGSKLLFGLAVFDVVGEFVAQGSLGITVTVSFIVACTILFVLIARAKPLATPGEHTKTQLPSIMVWVVGLWLLANFSPYLLVFLLTGQPFYQALSLPFSILVEMGLQALNLLLPLWWLRWRGISWREGIAWRRPGRDAVIWGAGGLGVTLIWAGGVAALLPGASVTPAAGQSFPFPEFVFVLFGLTVLWIVTIAGEEVMFRGWMQTQLEGGDITCWPSSFPRSSLVSGTCRWTCSTDTPALPDGSVDSLFSMRGPSCWG